MSALVVSNLREPFLPTTRPDFTFQDRKSKCYKVAVSNLLERRPLQVGRSTPSLLLKAITFGVACLAGLSIVSVCTALADRLLPPSQSLPLKIFLAVMCYINYRFSYMGFISIYVGDRMTLEFAAAEDVRASKSCATAIISKRQLWVIGKIVLSLICGITAQLPYVFLAKKYNTGSLQTIMMALNGLDSFDPTSSAYLGMSSDSIALRFAKGDKRNMLLLKQEILGGLDSFIQNYVQGRNHQEARETFSQIMQSDGSENKKISKLVDYLLSPVENNSQATSAQPLIEDQRIVDSRVPCISPALVELGKSAVAYPLGFALTVIQLVIGWICCQDGMSSASDPLKYSICSFGAVVSIFLIGKIMFDTSFQFLNGFGNLTNVKGEETYIGERLAPKVSRGLKLGCQVLSIPAASPCITISIDYLNELWKRITVGALYSTSNIFFAYGTGRMVSEWCLEETLRHRGTEEQKADLSLYSDILEFREFLAASSSESIAKFLLCLDSNESRMLQSVIEKNKLTWKSLEEFLEIEPEVSHSDNSRGDVELV